MAIATSIIVAGAAIVGAGVAVAGVVQAKKAQKVAANQANEQTLLQNRQLGEELLSAQQRDANQDVRREATISERARERRISRARSQVLENQQIRERINEARIISAQQLAAGGAAGFTGTAGAAAADLATEIGSARTEGAFNVLLQQSQLRQQEIQTGLIEVDTLKGFKNVSKAPAKAQNFRGNTPVAGATRTSSSEIDIFGRSTRRGSGSSR